VLLDDDDIEAIAERVAAKLRHGPSAAARYGDAQTVAARFGLSVDYVYAHARELGVIRLGEGPRARLRFDIAEVERRLLANGRRPPAAAKPRRGGPRQLGNRPVELIPFEP
jgi:hypothetical protein